MAAKRINVTCLRLGGGGVYMKQPKRLGKIVRTSALYVLIVAIVVYRLYMGDTLGKIIPFGLFAMILAINFSRLDKK